MDSQGVVPLQIVVATAIQCFELCVNLFSLKKTSCQVNERQNSLQQSPCICLKLEQVDFFGERSTIWSILQFGKSAIY